MALGFAFFRPTWLVRTLPGRPRDAPGLNFRGPNDSFFDVCRFGCARFPTTSRPLRNTAWAHEFQASGLLRSSQHRAKTRFERCSGKGSRWQCARQGPGSIPREPTQRLRLPIWRPEQPTRRPRRPTWRPRQPNLAIRRRFQRVPVRPRAIPERPKRPRSKFRRFFVDFPSIFRRFSIEFSTNFIHCVRPKVSHSSCEWLLELARTNSTITPTTCEPTFYALLQGKCT